ncbi:MAG: hypothetical protein ACRDKX_02130 [Solirubrobacterales bacterium]
MGSATATGSARVGASRAGVRPAEFRAALGEALALADADDKVGPLIRAAGLRMRFEFPDAKMVLNLAAASSGKRHIQWSFSDDVGWEPKLELTMSSAVANRYLQGNESLAIAIARGQVHFHGESRVAVLYLPATRLLCEPYRKVIVADYPELVAV